MNVEGVWYNQLGSRMELHVTGKEISGKYQTAVGDASGEYALTGKVDTDLDQSTAIGWVVLWNNQSRSSDSVTTWSGQARSVDGVETIVSIWLLAAETESDDEWHSTLVGKDIFTRTKPSDEEVRYNLKFGLASSAPAAK